MNTVLEAWANTLPIPFPVHDPTVLPPPSEKSGLVTFKAVPGQEQVQTTNAGGYGESQAASIGYSDGKSTLDMNNNELNNFLVFQNKKMKT